MIILLSLLFIAFFVRKRRATSREKGITNVPRPFGSIEDANNPSTIAVHEIGGNSLSRHKEMADTGIFELPHAFSVSELTGSTPTLVSHPVPDLRQTLTRPGQLTESSVARSFKKRRHAAHVSTRSSIEKWRKQMKTPPANNQNKQDGTEKCPGPYLNRALPPIPRSEDDGFSCIKRNTVPDGPSDCPGIVSSPVPNSDRALYPTSKSESVRISWIMRNMVLVEQSSPQGIAPSDVDGVPRRAKENFL